MILTKYSKGIYVLLFAIAAIAIGCQPAEETQTEETMKFIDPANFDPNVRPQDDFFVSANNGWLSENPIPSDKSSWGSFVILAEENRENLKNIIDEVVADENAAPGSNRQKVRDLYNSGMDTARLEELGAGPIMKNLEAIDGLQNVDELIRFAAYMHTQTISCMYGMRVDQDEKNPEEYILNAYQGGLGLPERDYYFNEDERSLQIQEEYRGHIANMFRLVGFEDEDANTASQKVYEIEKGLAENSRRRVELRDPERNYNKMTLTELNDSYSNFNWTSVMEAQNIPVQDELVIGQPEFFDGLERMLSDISLDDWKLYLKWKVITEASAYMSSDFEQENFRFYSTVMSGIQEMEPRWKRVTNTLSGSLGDAVSQLYVEKYFPPEAKKIANEMIDDIMAAFEERLNQLDWMGDTTKQKAIEKLSMFGRKIGYPDKWKDYSSIEITPGSYLDNLRNSWVYEYNRNISRLGQPIDKDEWLMPAAIVNAYYHPIKNEVVFPAGILQFPFFDFRADAAVNYGGIGAVIGHELTHGFDDQGSQFGGDGTLASWWTDKDREAFDSKTQVLVDQYNSYTVLDSVHVNGKLTLGENIADFGGLTIAFAALKKNWERNGKPEDIDGFSAEQRFFYSWAQVWRAHYKPEAVEQRIKTDTHSPAKWRVNGVVMNIPEFYEAFEIKEGDGMFRPEEERPIIW